MPPDFPRPGMRIRCYRLFVGPTAADRIVAMELFAAILMAHFIVLVLVAGFVSYLHAATKAGAFGSSLIMLAVVLLMPQLRILIQGALIVLFFYLTAPVAAHMIARAMNLKNRKAQ